MKRNITLVAIFIACMVFSAQYLCNRIDQEAEATKTEQETFEVYDMTIEAWKERKSTP